MFASKIKNFYGQEPIIYTLYNSYNKYIVDELQNNKIWIRDIFWTPKLKDGREWSIWQYSNRGRIKGIEGFVDLNVFKGSKKDFEKL